MDLEKVINAVIKLGEFIERLKKRDLLLFGFIGMFFFVLAMLTGIVKSPQITQAIAQHEMIMSSIDKWTSVDQRLVGLQQLQLYLARENCMHTAKTESEKSRCDRQDIRDAIIQNTFAPTSTDETSSGMGE